MDLTRIKVKEIPTEVRDWCETHAHGTDVTYVAWLEYKRGEIIERIFATRKYSKGLKIREVLRAATGGKSRMIARDLIYRRMNGYVPVFDAKDVYERQCGYGIKVFSKEEFGDWCYVARHIGFSYGYINPELLYTIPEFKYCGYSGGYVIPYINAYRKDKSIEFFGKMGLSLSPVLIKKAKIDGKFRRFLWDNHRGIQQYGVEAAMYAYKHGCSLDEARRICICKHQLDRLVAERVPEIRGTKLNRQKVLEYIDTNNINYASYSDYLRCCIRLNLDMTDTKVLFPNDFQRMHDLRSAEYASEEAKKDRQTREQLYKDFYAKAQEYKALECSNELYAIVCPMDISELIREGEQLSHCVGRMGYDKKVVDGKSIVMFVRRVNSIDTPYVTIEYRIDRKTLAQCYGYADTKPADDVIAFAQAWADSLQERIAI